MGRACGVPLHEVQITQSFPGRPACTVSKAHFWQFYCMGDSDIGNPGLGAGVLSARPDKEQALAVSA